MAMTRACSYTLTIETPQDPSVYSSVLITFVQGNSIIIEKNKTQLTIDGNKIIVQLTQAETKQFECGKKAYIQIRCYKAQYEAPGSLVWAIDVYPALDDVILPT